MQPKHFIQTLVEGYERAFSIISDADLHPKFVPALAEYGVWCANEVAANNWGDPARAGQVAGALLRAIYGADAPQHATNLHAWVMMSVANTTNPPTREELGLSPFAPTPLVLQP